MRDLGLAEETSRSLAWRRLLPAGLARPVLLSLHNAFRRRQRLWLTLAALAAGGAASSRLAELLRDGAPATEADVALATKLIEEAGGVAWASAEARLRLDRAIARLADLELVPRAAAELVALGRYIVDRDR